MPKFRVEIVQEVPHFLGLEIEASDRAAARRIATAMTNSIDKYDPRWEAASPYDEIGVVEVAELEEVAHG